MEYWYILKNIRWICQEHMHREAFGTLAGWLQDTHNLNNNWLPRGVWYPRTVVASQQSGSITNWEHMALDEVGFGSLGVDWFWKFQISFNKCMEWN
jgi:hypothetical protein